MNRAMIMNPRAGRKQVENRRKPDIFIFAAFFMLLLCSISFSKDFDAKKNNWLTDAILKLEKIRDDSIADIRKSESEIQRSESTIRKSEEIMKQAQQKGNVQAESIARQASQAAREAIAKNRERKRLAEQSKKRAEELLVYAKTGGRNFEARLEQLELENNESAWIVGQKKLIEQRIISPNRWGSAIYTSLKTKMPPLPYKRFDELEPGDVLLIGGSALITKPDRVLSGNDMSSASHTVLYLKEVNGRKLFLDNQPDEGPRIVPEEYIMNKYGSRSMEVAKLAQPLKKDEAERLYKAAREMRTTNLEKIGANNWFDKTSYGAWGKENVVCSEADWALIRSAGRNIPKSDDVTKKRLGIDFSPADFYGNDQYFLVSPLAMPKR